MRDDELEQELEELEMENLLSSGLLDRDESVLVIIDVQERYIPHLFEGARVVEAARRPSPSPASSSAPRRRRRYR